MRYKIGDRVLHPNFGRGSVIDTAKTGMGDAPDRVQVRFDSTLCKWLALEYARLTLLDKNSDKLLQEAEHKGSHALAHSGNTQPH